MGLSPLSEEAHQLYHNQPALLFTDVALMDVQHRNFRQLGGMLGTFWTREMVEAMTAPQRPNAQQEPRETMALPLLLGLKPQIRDILKESFGNTLGITPPEWYRQNQGEVIEGFDLSRADFVKVASMFTGLIPTPQLG